MAKLTKALNIKGISPELMTKAREAAQVKLARQIAEQELGISDSGVPVLKGPMPVENERMCDITLDLAPHSDRLFVDGVIYMHGRTYTVPQRLYDTMREMVSRGWQHQEEIDGKDRNFYRRAKTVTLRPDNASAHA